MIIKFFWHKLPKCCMLPSEFLLSQETSYSHVQALGQLQGSALQTIKLIFKMFQLSIDIEEFSIPIGQNKYVTI